jgi:hypothetical protein
MVMSFLLLPSGTVAVKRNGARKSRNGSAGAFWRDPAWSVGQAATPPRRY